MDPQPLDWTYKQALQSGHSGRTSTPTSVPTPVTDPLNAGISKPQNEINPPVPNSDEHEQVKPLSKIQLKVLTPKAGSLIVRIIPGDLSSVVTTFDGQSGGDRFKS